jgi:hypothetical protein
MTGQKRFDASGGDIFSQKKQGIINFPASSCGHGTGGDADDRARRSALACFPERGRGNIPSPFLLALNIPAGGPNLFWGEARHV